LNNKNSIANLEKVQPIADLLTNFEVSKKQTAVDLSETDSKIQSLKDGRQRSIMYCTIAVPRLIIVLSIRLYRRYLFIQGTKRNIEEKPNVSEATYTLIKDTYHCEYRG
jgi:hypothetical protein